MSAICHRGYKHALEVCEVLVMGLRQLMRSKMVLGSCDRRDDRDGSGSWDIIHLPRRNAYELIGLKRPVRNQVIRLKAD